MKKTTLLLLTLISSLLFFSCENEELVDNSGQLTLSNINLPDLDDDGYKYQSWLLVNGTFVSVNTFSYADFQENGALTIENIDVSDLTNAQAFAITVESNTDDSQAQSNYVLLVGDFQNNVATLTTNNTTSNGITALGSNNAIAFTIQNATVPASNNSTDYSQNGIWFFKNTTGESESTLDLDFSNVNYQAWLKTNYQGSEYYIDMGVITKLTGNDNSNLYTTTPFLANLPDFAGEDFLAAPENSTFTAGLFPINVRNQQLIVTPIPKGYSSSTNPFPIHLFNATIGSTVENSAVNTYTMEVNTNYSLTATKQ